MSKRRRRDGEHCSGIFVILSILFESLGDIEDFHFFLFFHFFPFSSFRQNHLNLNSAHFGSFGRGNIGRFDAL